MAGHGTVDVVTDFLNGSDHFSIGTVGSIDTSATTFANIDDAYSYAKGQINGGAHGAEVSALQVGADTYLFWDSSHNTTSATIDSVVKLTGVAHGDIDTTDFV
jgi:serralysin